MKTSRKIYFHKSISWIGSFILLFLSYSIYAQTNTTNDGNWYTGSNWTSGTPSKDESATITNNMTINGDIEVDDGGSFVISGGTAIDPDGGSTYKLVVQGSGYFEVDGDVSFEGELNLKNSGEIIVKGCDTLIIGGDAVIENNSDFTIEDCAVVIIKGNLEVKNNADLFIDGQLKIEGDMEASNNAEATGTGNIQVDGSTDFDNSSNFFGSSNNCSNCDYGGGAPLPIILGKFQANYMQSGTIEVYWRTYSEINNDFFTLYYSIDGQNFEEIKTIPGAGNSVEKLVYKTIIHGIENAETVYLKLRQTDFDGKYEDFEPIVVESITTAKNEINREEINLYPNPGGGNYINIKIKGLETGSYQAMLFNETGQLIESKPIEITDYEVHLKAVKFGNLSLEKGLYFVRIISSSAKLSAKYVVY